jgi:uncharacterized protein (DUF2249 family)
MKAMKTMTTVDVRATPPMHRFDTIMSAYEALPAGEAMHLIVDHDPKCMYYTLQAMRGDDTFDFEYLEDGPIDWHVVVTKLANVDHPTQR